VSQTALPIPMQVFVVFFSSTNTDDLLVSLGKLVSNVAAITRALK